MKTIWILNWSNESGDSGVTGFWTQEPSTDAVLRFVEEMFPDDFEAKTLYYDIELLSEIV